MNELRPLQQPHGGVVAAICRIESAGAKPVRTVKKLEKTFAND